MNGRMQGRAGATGGAIDLRHLDNATSGDRALQLELLALFDRQSTALLAQMEAATDLRTRQAAAHSLKGAARGVGAVAVAESAEEFEKAAGEPDRHADVLARLLRDVLAARREIAAILDRG